MGDHKRKSFAQDILQQAGDEPIQAVTVASSARFFNDDKERFGGADAAAGTVLTWEQAEPLLDYEYDAGWGGEDCHAVYAYTDTRVIFVVCYDGATWLSSVPRNPDPAVEPDMFGGG